MIKTNIKIALVLMIAGFGLIYFGFSAIQSEPPKLALPEDLKGVIIDSPPADIGEFALSTHKDEIFSRKNLLGKWTVLFPGYTNCPDVCPNSMRVMDQMYKQEGLPEGTQFVFMTVDPLRDTVNVMNDFVYYFNENIIGITGEKAEIDKLTQLLGVIYDYEGDMSTGDYIVNHGASVYFIDPLGRERAYVLPPHDVERVTRAFRLVTDYYR
ncbi:MAG: SCO family protein [Gammaproteobacteria bacterium]|nr:SCO family protein [Gammaproteobacteria bacterium]